METARLDVSKAPQAMAEVVERVRAGTARGVLWRDGAPVAALISVADLALFEQLLADLTDRIDVEVVRTSLAQKLAGTYLGTQGSLF